MQKTIGIALLLTACSSAPEETPDHFYLDKQASQHAVEWSYEGDTGPEHWGDLNPRYGLAQTGKMQSPIDIDTAAVVIGELPELTLRYRGEAPAYINNGHTIQHDQDDDGSELVVDGKHYRLEQFHIHAPSEHTFNGRFLPLELHLVHKAADAEIAVIAVLFEEGESSTALQLLAESEVPDHEGERGKVKQPILVRDLLPKEPEYYTYRGSFTTPPCTEDVRWFVLKYHVQATAPLLNKIAKALKNNNRPVQPLNGRTVQGN